MSKIMSAAEVKQRLDDALAKQNAGSAPAGYFVDLVCILLVNQAATNETLVKTIQHLNQRLKVVERDKGITPSTETADVPATEVQGAPAPRPSNGKVRLGADGQPLSEEERRIEEAMDAAIEAGEAEKGA